MIAAPLMIKPNGVQRADGRIRGAGNSWADDNRSRRVRRKMKYSVTTHKIDILAIALSEGGRAVYWRIWGGGCVASVKRNCLSV